LKLYARPIARLRAIERVVTFKRYYSLRYSRVPARASGCWSGEAVGVESGEAVGVESGEAVGVESGEAVWIDETVAAER
jgi:hypothetical protein